MKKSAEIVTYAALRQLLNYDPATGIFIWCVHRRQMRPGDIAGHVFSNGYRKIKIDKRFYGAHRLAWLYMTGKYPKFDIDHVNLMRDDNRFSNLREATKSQNHGNKPALVGKFGPKGAYYSERHRGKKWQASIRIDGRNKSLGYYHTPEEASAAYLAAAKKYFGEFARAS